jgi:hypothetical protein
MLPARTSSRLLTSVGLALGLVLSGSLSTAVAEPVDWSDPPPGPRTVSVGEHDHARLLPDGSGRTLVQALPRRDGSTPSLILDAGPSGTTLQTADDAEPTVLEGTAPRISSAAAAEDLVELRLDAVGRDGRPAQASVMVYDVVAGAVQATRQLPAGTEDCTDEPWAVSSCLLVPPGTYAVMALVTTNPADQPSTELVFAPQSVALVGDPETEITADREITLDARLAERVRVATPGRRTSVAHGGALQLGFSRTAANGRTASRELYPATLLDDNFYLQPTKAVTLGGFETLTRLRLEAPDIEMSAGGLRLRPEYYEAHWFSDVASDWPVWDGAARLRVAYVGGATPQQIERLGLRGAVAVIERSDDFSVAALSNAAAAAGAELVAIHNDGPGDNDDPNGTDTRLRVPTVRLTRAEGLALDRLPRGARVGVSGESASPYVYDLVLKESGRIPHPSYSFTTAELATQVHRFHGQPTRDWTATESAFQYQPGDTFAISRSFPLRDVPRSRTEYRLPDPETQWNYGVTYPEFPYNNAFPGPEVSHIQLGDQGYASYTAGERVTHDFGTAPLVAAFDDPVERSGDLIRIDLNGVVDGAGNWGHTASDAGSGLATELRVLADGEYVGGTTARPSGIAAVPTDTSTIEVLFTTDNPQPWVELSSRTRTRWTFPTAPVAEGSVEAQSVLVAEYDVPVDLRNRVRPKAGQRAAFEVTIDHHADGSTAPVDTVEVEASYDDGRTWRPATVTTGTGGRHRVVLPRGSGLVSLRLHATDAGGSTLDQTIIGAFGVR